MFAYRVVRAQVFGEGNKRIALLLACWVLDRNGVDGTVSLPADDRAAGDLLVLGGEPERQRRDLRSPGRPPTAF